LKIRAMAASAGNASETAKFQSGYPVHSAFRGSTPFIRVNYFVVPPLALGTSARPQEGDMRPGGVPHAGPKAHWLEDLPWKNA
jgi:hypothetical protein